MTKHRIVVGEASAELQAIQLLAFALTEAAGCVSVRLPVKPIRMAAAALLSAAGRALGLAGCAGLDTPIEVLALSARNTFELWLRLRHILGSDANCQSWRNEALTDQLQVLEAILGMEGPEETKAVIREEIKRVKEHGTARGLSLGQRPAMITDLANATGQRAEYEAFYKLYSKLVHPSSWFVNWPVAVSTPMYRTMLSVNAQTYGWGILELVDTEFGVTADICYEIAVGRFKQLQSGKATLPN